MRCRPNVSVVRSSDLLISAKRLIAREIGRIGDDGILRLAVRRAVVVVDEVADEHALGEERRALQRRRLIPDPQPVRQRIGRGREAVLLDRLVARAQVDDGVALAQRLLPTSRHRVPAPTMRRSPTQARHPPRFCRDQSCVCSLSLPVGPSRVSPLKRKTPLRVHRPFRWTLQRRCWSSPTLDSSLPTLITKVVPTARCGRRSSHNAFDCSSYCSRLRQGSGPLGAACLRHDGSSARRTLQSGAAACVRASERPQTAFARRTALDRRGTSLATNSMRSNGGGAGAANVAAGKLCR